MNPPRIRGLQNYKHRKDHTVHIHNGEENLRTEILRSIVLQPVKFKSFAF